eukprot:scaffold24312_cov16-Prasinocladus_malaysianus.AAC.4
MGAGPTSLKWLAWLLCKGGSNALSARNNMCTQVAITVLAPQHSSAVQAVCSRHSATTTRHRCIGFGSLLDAIIQHSEVIHSDHSVCCLADSLASTANHSDSRQASSSSAVGLELVDAGASRPKQPNNPNDRLIGDGLTSL